MSDEKLIPFDLEVAKRHPERVRDCYGKEPTELPRFAGDWVVARWVRDEEPIPYEPHEFYQLRLTAPPARKVKVWLCADGRWTDSSDFANAWRLDRLGVYGPYELPLPERNEDD